MNQTHFWTAIGAFGLGALVMYMMDPQQGRRRRALARDQLASAQRQISDTATSTYQDLRNRAYGLYAEVRGATGRPLPHAEQDEQQGQAVPQSSQYLGR